MKARELGPAYKHSAIMRKFLSLKSMFNKFAMNIVYNELISVNIIACFKRDPVYMHFSQVQYDSSFMFFVVFSYCTFCNLLYFHIVLKCFERTELCAVRLYACKIKCYICSFQ